MRNKLTAIINAPTDTEIKVELLEEYVRACCEDFLAFTVERNDLIMSALGIHGYMDDVDSMTKTELFDRFKDFLTEKYKPRIV